MLGMSKNVCKQLKFTEKWGMCRVAIYPNLRNIFNIIRTSFVTMAGTMTMSYVDWATHKSQSNL